jgi:TonB family protein
MKASRRLYSKLMSFPQDSARGTEFPYSPLARQSRPPGRSSISDLAIVRLNEPEEEEQTVLQPWPPPGGLAPEQDPFAVVAEEKAAPSLTLLPDIGPQPERWKLTTERAVYMSIILHLLLALAIMIVPAKFKWNTPKNPNELPDPLGIIKLMSPSPVEPPIPIQFFPAPGPKAKAPGPNPLPSDMNRVAHGGDPKLPKMTQPKAVPLPGIRDLDPGKRGERMAVKAAPPQTQGSPDGVPPDLKSSPDALAQNRAQGNDGSSPLNVPKLKGIPQPALEGLTAEQVRTAAQDAGQAGDEGGGWEHEGGFVDSGPISFDTVGYDWGAYAAEMIRKIKRNWDVPSLARYGIKGKLSIRFYILKDGRVELEKVIASSGIPPFDNAAFQAIALSSAFKPLPADLGHDREGVTVTFFYNIRPDEAEPQPPPARRARRGGRSF